MAKSKKHKLLVILITLVLVIGCKKEYNYSDIKDGTDFNFPIDNVEEAIVYSNNIQEFTNFRNKFLQKADWVTSAQYLTEKEHKRLFEKWYKSEKIGIEEYNQRIAWSEAEGDYWNVNWQSGGAFCTTQFRNNGNLKNVTGAGRGDEPFYCGYIGK